jgi:hypothetical protein
MKRLAALALVAALPALAAEVRVITPTSHSLFPAGAGAGAGTAAADASALKPPARALPSPILVERRADIGADGSLLLSCAGQDRRDFRRLPDVNGAAR